MSEQVLSGAIRGYGKKIGVDPSVEIETNKTAEVAATYVIPANAVKSANNVFRGCINWDATATASKNLTWIIKIGSTTVFTTGTIDVDSGVEGQLTFQFTVSPVSASGEILGNMVCVHGTSVVVDNINAADDKAFDVTAEQTITYCYTTVDGASGTIASCSLELIQDES